MLREEAVRIAAGVSGRRMMERLDQLAQFGRSPQGGVTRLAFSEEDRQARKLIVEWMARAGLEIQASPVGNIIGRTGSNRQDGPVVMTGSHLDSVVRGGQFDGALGVVAAIEAAHVLHESGVSLPCPLEVICFVMEESSRFEGGYAFGSRVMTGQPIGEEALLARDRAGKTLAEAIYELRGKEGGAGEEAQPLEGILDTVKGYVASSRYPMSNIKAFVELHIEQGPTLYATGKPVAAVTAIAAPTRFRVDLVGQQGHTGTTAMGLRKDALVAAAEVILAVERMCRSVENVVGTASVIEVDPNIINSIPGKARLSVDIRSTSAEAKKEMVRVIHEEIGRIANSRGVQCAIDTWIEDSPQPLSERVTSTIEQSCQALGIEPVRLPSGAGHDAAQVAKFVADVGMIFVPSRDGISHAQGEWTDEQDIAKGTRVLLLTLLDLAG